ncbi:MAG: hypothetical protein KC636_26890 [Myxococcales bacterium]|nr:hypothetical protein [Myxococcales bacterium]
MSYFFQFVDPTAAIAQTPRAHPWLGGDDCYEMNGAELRMMVEVMREAGILREQGMGPRWTIDEAGVPQEKFRSNSNGHVTPDECQRIASMLRAAIDSGSAGDTLSFFDDAPPQSRAWLESWTEFNARAAQAGGYRVT